MLGGVRIITKGKGSPAWALSTYGSAVGPESGRTRGHCCKKKLLQHADRIGVPRGVSQRRCLRCGAEEGHQRQSVRRDGSREGGRRNGQDRTGPQGDRSHRIGMAVTFTQTSLSSRIGKPMLASTPRVWLGPRWPRGSLRRNIPSRPAYRAGNRGRRG